MKQARAHKLTDAAQRFLADVEAHPFDHLYQDHLPNVKAWCRVEGYVTQNKDGTWSLTLKGAQAVSP